jgi:hypothetical protein
MAGALRAGQVILGAIHPLTYGIQLTAVPDAVAMARTTPARLTRFVLRLALGLGAASLAWGVAVWFVPTGLGQALFGATWDQARTTIPGQTLVAVAAGLMSGAVVGLRALAAARFSLRARIVSSVIGLAGAVFGATTGDVATCAASIGVAVSIGAVFWWASYAWARRHPGTPSAAAASSASLADEVQLEVDGVAADS